MASSSSLIPPHIQKLVGEVVVKGGEGPLDPLKPASDKRSYRSLKLSNGLTVVLISDPAADRAAAALVVGAGHLSDPRDLPGASHAVEHFCFLGSAAYPQESFYKETIKAAGGQTNASTSSETVTYHFLLNHDKLPLVLDVWSQFFSCPLFSRDSVERELNAINSENSRNLQEDGRRYYQVLKDTCNRDHVFSKFGTGSMETLRKPDAAGGIDATRDAVMALHSRFYRAPLMSLSVIGRQSLDDLEAMVTGRGERPTCDFNKVPSLPDYSPQTGPSSSSSSSSSAPLLPLHYAPVDKTQGHPYPSRLLGRIFWLTPLKEQRTLTLRFPLVDFPPVDFSSTLNLLSHIVGFEGKGSLLALLKRLGFADALSAGSDKLRHFSAFEIDLRLTKKGLENADSVVALIFRYLALVRAQAARSSPHLRALHAERAALAASNVRFAATVPPLSAVLSAASASQIFPSPLAVIGGSLPGDFDGDALMAALATLHPRNLHLTVQVREAGGAAAPLQPEAAAAAAAAAAQPSSTPSVAVAAVVTTTAGSGGTKLPPAHIPPVDPNGKEGTAGASAADKAADTATATSAAVAATAASSSSAAVTSFDLSEESYRHDSGASAVTEQKERYYGYRYAWAPLSAKHLELWGGGRTATTRDAFVERVLPPPATEDGPDASSSSSSPFLPLLHKHLERDGWHVGPLEFGKPTPDFVRSLLADDDTAAAATALPALSLPPLNPFIATRFDLADDSLAATIEARAVEGERGLVYSGGWEELTASSPTTSDTATSTAQNKLHVLPPSPFDFPTRDDAIVIAAAARGSDLAPVPPSSTAAWAQSLDFTPVYPKALALPFPWAQSKEAVASEDDDTTGLPSPSGVFIKQDRTFKLPKTFVAFRFLLPSSSASGEVFPSRTDFPPVASWQRSFLSLMVEELLNEALKYQASSAGMVAGVSLEAEKDVLRLTARGYSEKVPELLKATIAFLKDELLDETKHPKEAVLRPLFERLKDKWRRSINNRQKAQPMARADYLLQDFFSSSNLSDEETLRMLDIVTLEQVLSFWQEAVLDSRLQMRQAVMYGNADYREDAKRLLEVASSFCAPSSSVPAASSSPSPSPSTYFPLLREATEKARAMIKTSQLPGPERSILLKAGSDFTLTERHPSPFERNCAVAMHFQIGIYTVRNWALTRLLHQVLAQPFFADLRTSRQLGYIVRATFGNQGTVTVLSLEVQSANSSVDHIEVCMGDFIDNKLGGILAKISEEELASIAGILASQALEPDKTQLDEFGRVAKPITTETFDLHSLEAYAAALKTIKKADLVAFAEGVLRPTSPHFRRVTCRVVPPESAAGSASGSAGSPAGDAVGATPAAIINGGGPAVWPSMAKELGMDRNAFFARVNPALFEAKGSAEGRLAGLREFASLPIDTTAEAVLGHWAPTAAELIAVERAVRKRL